MRRSACAHVVLGVHLEEVDRERADVVRVLALEAGAGGSRMQGFEPRRIATIELVHGGIRSCCPEGWGRRRGVRGLPAPKQKLSSCDQERLIGCSEPLPRGVWMLSHVPFKTYFHELP